MKELRAFIGRRLLGRQLSCPGNESLDNSLARGQITSLARKLLLLSCPHFYQPYHQMTK